MQVRIAGLDLARSLAVIGMVVVNFPLAMGAATAGPEWLVWLAGLPSGRAAAMFVVLAGVGVSLMTRGNGKTGLLLRRAVFLFVVGLAYMPIWPADILHYYGVYLTVAALLVRAPGRVLWFLASLLVAVFPAMLLLGDYEAGWDFITLSYDGFWTPAGFLRNLLFNGFHPVIPWLAFLLVGMWLGRQDLRDRRFRARLLGWSVAVAAAGELVSSGLVRLFTGTPGLTAEDVDALFGREPMPPMPLYMVSGTAMAIAMILLCIIIAERFRGAVWLKPFLSTGELALTVYVAHVIVGMGSLETAGMMEDRSLAFALLAAAVFSLAALIFCSLWRWRFDRGPLEWLMRGVAAVSVARGPSPRL